MSLITDLVDGVLEGTGWAAGVAIVLGVAAASSRQGSPLVKSVMKGFLIASDRVKELVAEAGEQMADLYAEAKAEYEAGSPTLAAAGATAGVAAAVPTETAPASGTTRRRGRPPRASTEAPSAEAGTTTQRRRGRPPRAETAAGTEASGTTAPRRGRRPRAAGPSAEGGAPESA
jgi:hypothetical protein